MKLRIHNWNIHQTYRRDRSQPPWIKVHRNLFLNPKWVQLSDAQKGQLVSIWVLAADKDGSIPNDPSMVRKLCGLDKKPELETFIELGLIECDAKVASRWRQGGVKVTPSFENNDASESEEKQSRTKQTAKADARLILESWNGKYNRKIEATGKIEDRLRQGASMEDCLLVIDFKTKQWLGTKFSKYLQPSTLFSPSKFEDYLSEAREGDRDDGIIAY